jgi:hypothetical protein
MDTNTFNIHALPVSTQVLIMQRMDAPSLRKFIQESWRAKLIFRHEFDEFVDYTWDQFPSIPKNNELKQLVYRILAVHFEPIKPYRGQYFAKYGMIRPGWISRFRQAVETSPLPRIPMKDRNVDTLVFLEEVFVAVEWFLEKIQSSITFVCGLPRVAAQINGQASGSETFDTTTMEPDEDYRMVRALLLFHLFCELFFKPPTEESQSAQVAEQMSFLKALKPFQVGELDAVYGMVEDLIVRHVS